MCVAGLIRVSPRQSAAVLIDQVQEKVEMEQRDSLGREGNLADKPIRIQIGNAILGVVGKAERIVAGQPVWSMVSR